MFMCLTTMKYAILHCYTTVSCKRINNWPNSKKNIHYSLHVESQLSYAAITEKFSIHKLVLFEKKTWRKLG